MAGLQRSAVSFRRQGSSGLVWDDKLLALELNNQAANQEKEHEQEKDQENRQEAAAADAEMKPTSRSVNAIERSRSNGGQRGYRATGRVSPAIEPPSPKVSACGFCGAFGKPAKNHRKRTGKGRSR